ncbi:serine/arginine repetitive matrix protein 2-like isoform X2 [Limulus polyphemus]|uniref:Serine/arginine repetitive matrix protein 2-like isoform X2 n=1 Tax=Limulus polyphemus TaxID=6850 RepID=A0ABM1TQC4_LIMPO|nr:serine/arginine repetitive matrix protein 2-like isoform X2 [Limulus polyphemus]
MEKHFLLSAKQINSKYEENLESGAKNKRIKEYEMQALLALEMEAAMPSESTVEETIKKIVGLLRTMSFLSGPSVLNEFLLETVKDNYSHNLKDMLLELGEELNIPIFPEIYSPEKPLNDQSEFLGEDLFSEKSIPDSVSSGSTASGTSRHKTSTSLMRHPSLVDFKQTRQIVVSKYGKKENSRKKTRDKRTTKPSSRRFSPRVAARKSSPRVPKASPKKEVKQVCRNLFNTAKQHRRISFPGGKYDQKCQVTTPRGNRVLKTSFVPETPSHRQGPHVVLRKQARLRSSTQTLLNTDVVEESPDKVLKETEPLLNQRRPFKGLRRSCSFYDTEMSKSRNMEKANARLLAQRIRGCSDVSPHTLFSELWSSPKVCVTSFKDIHKISSNLMIHGASLSYNHKTPTRKMSTSRTHGASSSSIFKTPSRKLSSAPSTHEASSPSTLKTPSKKLSSAPKAHEASPSILKTPSRKLSSTSGTHGASSPSILKTPSKKLSSAPRTHEASPSILKTPSRKLSLAPMTHEALSPSILKTPSKKFSSAPRTHEASPSILKTPSRKLSSAPRSHGASSPSILKTPSKKLSSAPRTHEASPSILKTPNRKFSSASRIHGASPPILNTSLSLLGSPSQNTRSKTPAKQSISSQRNPLTPTSTKKIRSRNLFQDGDLCDGGMLSPCSNVSPEIKKTLRSFREGRSLNCDQNKTCDNEVHWSPKVILTHLNHFHSDKPSLEREENKCSADDIFTSLLEENIDPGSGVINENVKQWTIKTNNKVQENLSLKLPRFTRGKSKEMGVSSDFFTTLTTKSPPYQHPVLERKGESSPSAYKTSLSCVEKLETQMSESDVFGSRKRSSIDECTTKPLQKRRRTGDSSRIKSEVSLSTYSLSGAGQEFESDEVFLVSPFNKTRDPPQSLDNKGVTPRRNSKQNYTPPSALSLLHLTTSPVVMRETNSISVSFDSKKDYEANKCRARRSLCNKLQR